MKRGCFLSVVVAFLATLGCNAQPRSINRTTVGAIDLRRYMGRWYEIARFDHSFERNMEYCEAFYAEQDDGMIMVTNTGVNAESDKRKTSYGKAKAGKSPGQLRVSFFWIFYSDYNVLEMGEKGEWALVGSRSPQYLWILSRTPTLPDATVDYIVGQAAERGYSVKNLIFDR